MQLRLVLSLRYVRYLLIAKCPSIINNINTDLGQIRQGTSLNAALPLADQLFIIAFHVHQCISNWGVGIYGYVKIAQQ
jgi:hypothetical protein